MLSSTAFARIFLQSFLLILSYQPSFGVLPVNFTKSSPCIQVSNTCSVQCGSTTFNLTSILTNGGNRRLFFSAPYHGFSYAFIVPLCSINPPDSIFPAPSGGGSWNPVPSFAQATNIWQLQSGSSHNDIFLGVANLTSMSYGVVRPPNQSPAHALSVTYTNGDYCGIVGANRITTLYFACNTSLDANQVNVIVIESPTCQYQIVAYTKTVCTQLPPWTGIPTAMPTVEPSWLPTATPTSEVVNTWSPSIIVAPTSQPSVTPTLYFPLFASTAQNPAMTQSEIATIVITVTISVLILVTIAYCTHTYLVQRYQQQQSAAGSVSNPPPLSASEELEAADGGVIAVQSNQVQYP